MAEIVVKVYVSGLRDGQAWPEVGGTLDVSDVEASELVRAGFAEYATGVAPEVPAVPAPEAATAPTPEVAAKVEK